MTLTARRSTGKSEGRTRAKHSTDRQPRQVPNDHGEIHERAPPCLFMSHYIIHSKVLWILNRALRPLRRSQRQAPVDLVQEMSSSVRARLTDFYRVFNAEKAEDSAFIDGLVSKYGKDGRDGEERLFAKLRQRYGGGGAGTNAHAEERRTVPLFGGAFFAQVPGRFADLSLVRQVPDHQEVWHEVLTAADGKGPGDADSEGFGAVFVVELMELETSVPAAAAAEHYFGDLAKDNAARDSIVAARESFAAGPGGTAPSSAPLLPAGAVVSVVHGMQFVRRGKARGEGGEDGAEAEARGDVLDGTAEVFVSVACIRLEKYKTDVVCSLSTPRRRSPKAAAAAAKRAAEAAAGAERAAAALARAAAEVAADASAAQKKKTNAEAAAAAAAAAAVAAKEAAAMAEAEAAKEAAAAAAAAALGAAGGGGGGAGGGGDGRPTPSAARKALPPLARRRAMCCARFYAFLRSLSLVDAGKVFAEGGGGGVGGGTGMELGLRQQGGEREKGRRRQRRQQQQRRWQRQRQHQSSKIQCSRCPTLLQMQALPAPSRAGERLWSTESR